MNVERIFFISKGRSLIPSLNFSSLFGNNGPTKLEICSGVGDWIIQRAQDETDCNWLALEMRFERVYHIWSKMIFEEVKNLAILAGEAHFILTQSIPINSLHEVYINFPDPPVWEESKQRLINNDLLNLLHLRLQPDASLMIATDDEVYARSISKELESHRGFVSCFDTSFLTHLPEGYGSSYFDRLWKQGQKKKRYFLKYQRKVIPSE